VEQKNKQACAVTRLNFKLIQNAILWSCFLDNLWGSILTFIQLVTGSHSPEKGLLNIFKAEKYVKTGEKFLTKCCRYCRY